MTDVTRDGEGGASVAAEPCTALGADRQRLESFAGREVKLGPLAVSRVLPVRDRRLVGPWCFLDRFGPTSFTEGRPMDVAPHPHIGLQTVTWLLEGEIVHDDSLRCEATARPGAVNVMTAGAGIAHAEQTPVENSGRLDGVQLWVALPEAERRGPASFEHLAEVPALELRGGLVHVFSGALGSARSRAPHYSDLVGAEVRVHAGETVTVPLEPSHEHAVLVLRGDAAFEGQPLADRLLYYLGTCRSEASFASRTGARVLLVGGPPFPERILMWWNFVARTPEEIAEARADWEARRRFGDVPAYRGPRLSAPALMRLARPEPMS